MEPLMVQEAREAARVVERLLKENEPEVRSLARFLKRKTPPFALTLARGSSDQAALFAKYLLEARLGLLVAPLAPSVTTLYGQVPGAGGLLLVYSQSGESPDLVEVARAHRARGSLTVAFVNREESPLAQAAEVVLPLHAGEEKAVAATKSFLAMLAATLHLLAHLQEDKTLLSLLPLLPEALDRAEAEGELEALVEAEGAYVVGRGFTLAAAGEAALKLKEVALLHAEAVSAAELLHGPIALLSQGLPLLFLLAQDRPLQDLLALLEALKEKGARVLVLSSEPEALALAPHPLRLPTRLSPELDPLLLVRAFYPLAAALGRARGVDVDRPPYLGKVTRTL
jgi:glucosamine--fructose-6-phosphate aminotransferase (isomerizing)